LNREIPATGRGNLRRMPEYKALRVIAVDPRHTSRTCAACGHVDARSRRARAFECVACGLADHADLNAVRNIGRRGPALLHGEERSGLPTPATPRKGAEAGGVTLFSHRYKSRKRGDGARRNRIRAGERSGRRERRRQPYPALYRSGDFSDTIVTIGRRKWRSGGDIVHSWRT
ncbi:MAG: transposase, partial [Alphaproteobacteria bacterium]|nr:transposase [Alphaproteobacteria bacterium]